ncbi:MAG: Crp/Fnr family transcriptional regulator [bacterium]|nr:Crp/Fnr family transcriptional regulator [bacterium]
MDKLKAFFDQYRKVNYKKGEVILQEETPENIFYIQKGFVKVYTISDSGDEKLILIYQDGEIFPLPWAINDVENNFFFGAASDITLNLVPKQDFVNYLKTEPEVMYYFLQKSLDVYKEMEDRVQNLEQSKASLKIIYLFQFLAQRFGKIEKDKVNLNLRLAHHDIASLVGISRETASIEIKKLQDQKIISLSEGRTVVDLNKIK